MTDGRSVYSTTAPGVHLLRGAVARRAMVLVLLGAVAVIVVGRAVAVVVA